MARRFTSQLNPKAMLFGFLLAIFIGVYMGLYFVDKGAFIIRTFNTYVGETVQTPAAQIASGQPDINLFLIYIIPVLMGVYIMGYIFGRFGRKI